jgi:glucose dehydrogenase
VLPAGVARSAAAILLVAGSLAVAGCGSSSSSESAKAGGEGFTGIDLSNTRLAQGQISRSNVSTLQEAWRVASHASAAYGAFASTPVVADGVVYVQDLESNVMAIDLQSGDVLWTKHYGEPDPGPNGVAVAGGLVYGATPEAAFALDQATGKQIWSVPLVEHSGEAIDMAPGYHEGRVYVSTAPMGGGFDYKGGGVGVLWALDAKTGKKVWHFDTVPKDLWGNEKVNSGGGLWHPPAFDGKGFMYFGVGNPAPFPGTSKQPWGASRPGPNLYTDSMVKLNEATGKLQWYYQQTPHDLYDWDFQDPPILAADGGHELAIGAGKSGVVVAIDTGTGKPVWKRSVGIHNGHDNDGLYAMRREYSTIKTGKKVYPGALGGSIAPMASNSTTVFVPVLDSPNTLNSGAKLGASSEATGELVAIDVKTGKVVWDKKFTEATFGSPIAINDLVFVATYDGTVHALDAGTGGEAWQTQLPAGFNGGLTASGNTLIAPAGAHTEEGQEPAVVAYRLGG